MNGDRRPEPWLRIDFPDVAIQYGAIEELLRDPELPDDVVSEGKAVQREPGDQRDEPQRRFRRMAGKHGKEVLRIVSRKGAAECKRVRQAEEQDRIEEDSSEMDQRIADRKSKRLNSSN